MLVVFIYQKFSKRNEKISYAGNMFVEEITVCGLTHPTLLSWLALKHIFGFPNHIYIFMVSLAEVLKKLRPFKMEKC